MLRGMSLATSEVRLIEPYRTKAFLSGQNPRVGQRYKTRGGIRPAEVQEVNARGPLFIGALTADGFNALDRSGLQSSSAFCGALASSRWRMLSTPEFPFRRAAELNNGDNDLRPLTIISRLPENSILSGHQELCSSVRRSQKKQRGAQIDTE